MSTKGKVTILYTHSVKSSFVRNDLALLEANYRVKKFYFDPSSKVLIPFVFLKQMFHILFNLRKTQIFITQFAGYQSYLPGLFSRLFKKKSLIILGGSDCVSFPSFNYGNFNKKLLGNFTRWSYNHSTHLAPVAEQLIKGEWNYYSNDGLMQGVKVFAPKAKINYKVIPYGYPADKFKRTDDKIENSFLMVGFLNKANYFRKGVDLIIELAKNKPEYQFTIIGGDETNLPAIDIPKNITFYKSVSYDELQQYYSRSKYYLQISICEGFPSALCEAMLCECIPIVSDVAAMPEIVGDTGYILNKRSAEDFIALIDAIAEDKSTKSGEAARKRIMSHYPVDKRQELIEYINDILLEKT